MAYRRLFQNWPEEEEEEEEQEEETVDVGKRYVCTRRRCEDDRALLRHVLWIIIM